MDCSDSPCPHLDRYNSERNKLTLRKSTTQVFFVSIGVSFGPKVWYYDWNFALRCKLSVGLDNTVVVD